MKTVVSNSTFDRGSLSPTYVKPFDVFANAAKLEIGSPRENRTADPGQWKGGICQEPGSSGRTVGGNAFDLSISTRAAKNSAVTVEPSDRESNVLLTISHCAWIPPRGPAGARPSSNASGRSIEQSSLIDRDERRGGLSLFACCPDAAHGGRRASLKFGIAEFSRRIGAGDPD